VKEIKVDIIIPCFNSDKWIKESIMSALNQTYLKAQVTFVDNESTDNSLKVAKSLQKDHPQLRVFEAPNLYEYSWEEPVSEALKHCDGQYFIILAADDVLHENYVSNVINVIDKSNGKIKIMQSALMGFSQTLDKPTGIISHSYKTIDEFKKKLFEKCPVTTPTLVYARSLYDQGYIQWDSKTYKGSGDYNCYFNLADKNIFIYPFPKWLGYYYRWHMEQSTWGMHKNFSNLDLKIKEYWKGVWSEKGS